MAQHDYDIANQSGSAFRADLNNALAAIVSSNSGASAPSTTYAYQIWIDSSTSPATIRQRDASNSSWITTGYADGKVVVPDGTAAIPAVQFSGSGTDTGFYSPGVDQVAISTGGAERLRITSAGLVGIGTSSPGVRLQVQDSIAGGSDGTVATLHNFSDTGGDTRYVGLNFRIGSDNGTSAIRSARTLSAVDYRTELSFWTNPVGSTQTPVRAMTIDHAQRVGIGTTSPGYLLTVSGGATSLAANQYLRFGAGLFASGDGSATNYLFTGSSGLAIRNATDSSEFARIDSSGRFLVGTSSTSQTSSIVVQGNNASATGGAVIRLGCGTDTPTNGALLGAVICGDNTHGTFVQLAGERDGGSWSSISKPSRLVFSTTADGGSSPTERMRITSGSIDGANFLFNCTSVPNSSVKGSGISAQAFGNCYISACNTPNPFTHLSFANTNGTVGSIETDTFATYYITSSDYRLKENVIPVTDGIARLQQLKPSRFNFITDPAKTVDGFLAHEVQAVVPEAITREKDAVDDDGNPVYQGIDQSKLVPLLTAALQEAVKRIETLEQRLNDAGIN